jgi:hypothetical protein
MRQSIKKSYLFVRGTEGARLQKDLELMLVAGEFLTQDANNFRQQHVEVRWGGTIERSLRAEECRWFYYLVYPEHGFHLAKISASGGKGHTLASVFSKTGRIP